MGARNPLRPGDGPGGVLILERTSSRVDLSASTSGLPPRSQSLAQSWSRSTRRGSNRCTDPCVAGQDLKARFFEGPRFGGRPLFIEEPSSSRHSL